MPGISVGLLGIDGIGKSEVVSAIEGRCAQAGLSVRRVSWQRYLSTADTASFPGEDLERIWTDLYRLFFTDALICGEPLEVPESFRELSGLHDRLRTSQVEAMRPESAAATCWAEVAGHTLFHHAVVTPLVRAGHVVIQESLGVKNVLKSLLMAEDCNPQAPSLEVVRALVCDYFGETMAPDLGIHLIGDPRANALARSADKISLFDSLRAFGGDPRETYLDLQSRCAQEFAAFATKYGWHDFDLRAAHDSQLTQTGYAVADQIVAALAGPTATAVQSHRQSDTRSPG